VWSTYFCQLNVVKYFLVLPPLSGCINVNILVESFLIMQFMLVL